MCVCQAPELCIHALSHRTSLCSLRCQASCLGTSSAGFPLRGGAASLCGAGLHLQTLLQSLLSLHFSLPQHYLPTEPFPAGLRPLPCFHSPCNHLKAFMINSLVCPKGKTLACRRVPKVSVEFTFKSKQNTHTGLCLYSLGTSYL